ncbi:MAG: YdjY domain-containing protein [Chthoniobacteraceae bacterium]
MKFSLALPFLAFVVQCAAAEPTAAPTAPTMQEISPGIYQIGLIRLDQAKHTATFPGKLNMAEGALEYLLVTTEGATHESLLSTTVQPADLHFSMLLLGAKGAGITTPGPDDSPPTQINKEYLQHAVKLKGDNIHIAVKWKSGAAEKTTPVEDWLTNLETKKSAPRGPWIYTGSMFREGHFLAQAEGAFAALVTYPAALINNPRKGSDNDVVWEVNKKAVPAVDTPVEIIITLEPAPDSKPASQK